MSIFIKAGLWVEKKLGFKGEFDLTNYVQSLLPTPLPYKSYVAIITQSGTSAPVVDTLFENNIGAAVTYAYNGVGEFNIKTSGHKFTSGKTSISITPGRKTSANTFLGTTITNDETITIYSYNPSGTATNGLISQVLVEIRVYN